jgi:hypothetical protein
MPTTPDPKSLPFSSWWCEGRPVRRQKFVGLVIATIINPADQTPVPVPDGWFGDRRGKPEQKRSAVPRGGFNGLPIDHCSLPF